MMTSSPPTPGQPPANPRCWCGHADLRDFSPDYLRCPECDTLVVRAMRGEEISRVEDDDQDFYGKNYYLRHVQEDYGLPDLRTRARTDLPERCLHWLRTFLKFVPGPGSRVLELGCGHGGFVAMLRWAGHDATGLELSPWLTERAREWFAIPTLTGRLEEHDLPEGSLDCVALMDVLEHLPDPRATMLRAARLLRPGGFLLVQTPAYPTAVHDDAAMRAVDHPFLEQLKPVEHLHLFSQNSARRLMAEVGLREVAFETPMFARYDMFFVASARPLVARAEAAWAALLEDPSAPAGRAVLAMLDLADQNRALSARLERAETDATARQEQVEELLGLLAASESDRAARGRQVEELTASLVGQEDDRDARGRQVVELTALLHESETDRAARAEQVQELTTLLQHSETDRAARAEQVHKLTGLLQESETDRAARAGQIEKLTGWLQESEADRANRLEQIVSLTAQIHRASPEAATAPAAEVSSG